MVGKATIATSRSVLTPTTVFIDSDSTSVRDVFARASDLVLVPKVKTPIRPTRRYMQQLKTTLIRTAGFSFPTAEATSPPTTRSSRTSKTAKHIENEKASVATFSRMSPTLLSAFSVSNLNSSGRGPPRPATSCTAQCPTKKIEAQVMASTPAVEIQALEPMERPRHRGSTTAVSTESSTSSLALLSTSTPFSPLLTSKSRKKATTTPTRISLTDPR
mmetsp:Transcript_13494/g.35745  ORF Transcript_13494/g.35745 Transcript_13494/m.35745 type:complete len:217 (+) Transcript_13494:73-723(+)